MNRPLRTQSADARSKLQDGNLLGTVPIFFPAHARVTAASGPNEEWFPWKGASIHLDRFPCAASPLTVIVVHGGGGYGRLFVPIGKLLHAAGYEVVTPDLPGYGLSQAPPSLVTYQAWTDLLCDLASTEYQNTGRRVVLCGGSLGGYLAYLCAARMGAGPIAGVIATTLADPRSPLVRRQFTRNALVLHAAMPLLPFCAPLFGRLRLPVKWFTKMGAMSSDPALNRLVAEDPMVAAYVCRSISCSRFSPFGRMLSPKTSITVRFCWRTRGTTAGRASNRADSSSIASRAKKDW